MTPTDLVLAGEQEAGMIDWAWLLVAVFGYLLAGGICARLYLALLVPEHHLNYPASRHHIRGNMWAILFLWPVMVPLWAIGKGVRWLLLPARLR